MSQTNKRAYAPPRQPQGAPRNARPPQPPRRTAAPRQKGFRGDLLPLLIGGLVVAVLAFFLQTAWPEGFPLQQKKQAAGPVERVSEIHSAGPVRINEVMSANRNSIIAEDGTSPDWIEIINLSGEEINLAGYTLAKTANSTIAFTFPEMMLGAGETVVVLADSRLRTDAQEALHAPFRLSSSGDTLLLFNPHGAAIDTLNLPELGADQSYARMDTALWQISDTPTPGQPNTEAGLLALSTPSGDSPVVITELMSSNSGTYADENGQYYDYIELNNRTASEINLSGWYISDDAQNPRKWRFPDCSIPAGGYLLIYASKLDRTEDAVQLHTNFSLSSEGETLILSNPQGQLMDRVDFGLLKADQAWAMGPDGTWAISAPSPGREN